MIVMLVNQHGIASQREVSLDVPDGAEAAFLSIEGLGKVHLQPGDVVALVAAGQQALAALSPTPEDVP